MATGCIGLIALCAYTVQTWNGGWELVIISLGYWGGMGSIAQGLHGDAIEPTLGPVFDFYFGSFVPLTHEFRGDKRENDMHEST